MADNSFDIYDAEQKQTDISKCPNCGANLTYNPEKECLFCEHCGTEQDFERGQAIEHDFELMLISRQNSWGEETHVFRCENCGAKEILSKRDISKACSFCGTSNVVETEELSGLKPNAVVPFKITKENACTRVIQWAKRKIFAPKKFKKSVTPADIAGTFNPAFTFDSETFSTYSGKLGKRYVTTRRVNGKTMTKTTIRYYNISGVYSYIFDDVLIQASDSLNQKDLNKLAPFDTNDSNQYSSEFLQGFTARQYSKDGKCCWQEARQVIDKSLKSRILSKYSYDVVAYLNVNTHYNSIKYKYLLLPLYVGHCNYKSKIYNFFVNGKNGKVAGKTPVSALKVFAASVLGAVILAGLGILAYFFLM